MTIYRTWYNDESKWLPTCSAWALYDGGWRADCREELMAIEGMSEEEADEVCEAMQLCADIIAQEEEED